MSVFLTTWHCILSAELILPTGINITVQAGILQGFFKLIKLFLY